MPFLANAATKNSLLETTSCALPIAPDIARSNNPVADRVQDSHARVFIQLHRSVDLTRGDQILLSLSAKSDRPFAPVPD